MRNDRLQYILKICFLVAIEAIFCFTPLGSVPIGPIVATLSAVPVIIASLTFGAYVGMFLGFVFGLFSFIVWTFVMPAHPMAFIFTPFGEFTEYKGNVGSLIICFLPRILVGLTPALTMKLLHGNESVSHMVIASVIGSLTNTVLVLTFIALFFGREYSTIMGMGILTILGTTVLTNGIPEAIVAGIVCPLVSRIIKKI